MLKKHFQRGIIDQGKICSNNDEIYFLKYCAAFELCLFANILKLCLYLYFQGSQGIRQWPINLCDILQKCPFRRLKLVVETFGDST